MRKNLTPFQKNEANEKIRLGDVIHYEITMSEEDLEKIKHIKTEDIYKTMKLPWLKIYPSFRIFEQYSGNTVAKCTQEGSADITLFSKEKVKRWKKKHSDIRYIHIGLIQVQITAFFEKE